MVGHANAKALADTLPLGHGGFDDPGVPRSYVELQRSALDHPQSPAEFHTTPSATLTLHLQMEGGEAQLEYV